MQDILALVGPTASGKTEWGLKLAREENGEIISVDSRQVYRFLSVGTAKPKGTWTAQGPSSPPPLYRVDHIPYHLVDFWDPAERFSAAAFVEQARAKIAEIRARGKKPIFVGGTGLYYKALVEGLAPMPPGDEALRAELRSLAEKQGRPFLHRELHRVDPEAAARIPANNIARVIRALEVFRLTGKPISRWHQEHQSQPSTASLRYMGIDVGREELRLRIEDRSRRMIAEGMIEETQALLDKGYPETCPALTGLGYPRIVAYLQGKITQAELIQLLIQDTRQYAKRQMTWFKNQCEVEWKK